MNNETKLSLTIALQGSVMFSKEECLKTTQKVVEKKTKSGKVYKKVIKVQVEDWDKVDKHIIPNKPKPIVFYTRKTKPATQSINLCKEAYDYMVSRECPEWGKIGVWNQMSPKQRLEAHLKRIASHFNGRLISYKVFSD